MMNCMNILIFYENLLCSLSIRRHWKGAVARLKGAPCH